MYARIMSSNWYVPITLVLCFIIIELQTRFKIHETLHEVGVVADVEIVHFALHFFLVSPLILFALFLRSHHQLKVSVNEKEKAEKVFRKLANQDALTRMPNRLYVEGRISEYVDRTANGQNLEEVLSHDLIVYYIDLDHFKYINDTFGHSTGDKVLIRTANIIKETFQKQLKFRVSGDEFVAVDYDNPSREEQAKYADILLKRLTEGFDIDGIECKVGASIGIAVLPVSEITEEFSLSNLLSNADLAMSLAKQSGRNTYVFFEDQFNDEFQINGQTANYIKNALKAKEFSVLYQPQFKATSLDLVGIEALVRWNHPTRGCLTPDLFLHQAQVVNLLAAIDDYVFMQVMEDIAKWESAGLEIPKTSINVSQQRLYDPNFLTLLENHAEKSGKIAFELMESIFFDKNESAVLTTIEKMKDLGYAVEIDDFGTGHSSIISLTMCKPDAMKIDRDLIEPMLRDPSSLSLTRHLIEIAKSLGIKTIAEGVQTAEHADMLRVIGCDTLQGHGLAYPMESETLINLYTHEKRYRA